jgi:hypothetical protein
LIRNFAGTSYEIKSQMRAAGIFESSFNSKAKRRFEKSPVAAKGIVPAKSVYNLT